MNIPKDHQSLMPYMIVAGAPAFILFVENVFGGTVTSKHVDEQGGVVHCEMQINGSTIMFGGSTPEWPPRTCDMFIYVDNADQTFSKALKAGAKVIQELSDKEYGRAGGIKDAFGNIWWITQVMSH